MEKKFAKPLSALAAVLILAGIFSCKKNNSASEKKLNIVATVFPAYDWTRQIAGDTADINISLLMKNGVDLHSFSPTAQNIIQISECDILIYVGGESDRWIQDALKNKTNKNRTEINLMEILGSSAKEEEVVEGMETDEGGDDEEEPEYDEHVWLSVKNAKLFCEKIECELSRMLPEHSETFRANLSQYKTQLENLDKEFEDACKNIPNGTMIFCDRFPFRYFTEDYNLNYYAAFLGCSAESEASFKTVAFLAEKIDELGAPEIFVLEKSDQKIAKTVMANATNKNVKIIALDSLQSTDDGDIRNGKTYISAMKNNLEKLR